MSFFINNQQLDNIYFKKRDDFFDFRYINVNTKEYLDYVTYNYNNLKTNQELIENFLLPSQLKDENQNWYSYLVDEYLNPKLTENNEEQTRVQNAMENLKLTNEMLNEIKTIIENTQNSIEKKKANISFTQKLKNKVNQCRKHNNENEGGDNKVKNTEGGKNTKVKKTNKRKTNTKLLKK
jgi:hypothetical protein